MINRERIFNPQSIRSLTQLLVISNVLKVRVLLQKQINVIAVPKPNQINLYTLLRSCDTRWQSLFAQCLLCVHTFQYNFSIFL